MRTKMLILFALLFMAASCEKDSPAVPEPIYVSPDKPEKVLVFEGALGFRQITYIFECKNYYKKVVYLKQQSPGEQWTIEEVFANCGQEKEHWYDK